MDNTPIAPNGATPPSQLTSLSDFELDQKIVAQRQMIDSAIAGRESAVAMVRKCEKSAVLSAWRLGQFLVEKKRRLGHGSFGPWLEANGISSSTASDYMRLARQIASTGNLGPSIRATLRALPPARQIGSAADLEPPPSKPPPAVVEPAPAAAVEPPEPVEPPPPDDRDALIDQLREDLHQSEERLGIMEESLSPESRAVFDRLNNQLELIRTLKASVAEWQSKHADAQRELRALRRRAAA